MTGRRVYTMSEAERVGQDCRRMQDLKSWPRWPWLPVKRRVATPTGLFDTLGDLELGAIHADHVVDGHVRVYDINVFRASWFPPEGGRFKEYGNIGECLDDGWRID